MTGQDSKQQTIQSVDNIWRVFVFHCKWRCFRMIKKLKWTKQNEEEKRKKSRENIVFVCCLTAQERYKKKNARNTQKCHSSSQKMLQDAQISSPSKSEKKATPFSSDEDYRGPFFLSLLCATQLTFGLFSHLCNCTYLWQRLFSYGFLLRWFQSTQLHNESNQPVRKKRNTCHSQKHSTFLSSFL